MGSISEGNIQICSLPAAWQQMLPGKSGASIVLNLTKIIEFLEPTLRIEKKMAITNKQLIFHEAETDHMIKNIKWPMICP